MYLALPSHTPTGTYQIRQSCQDMATGLFSPQLVFDLNTDPTQYMEYIDDVGVFFDSMLEEAVGRFTDEEPSTILEKLLWPFFPRPIREHLSRFDRTDRWVPPPISEQEQRAIDEQFHIFDRRRLYFIHYRAVDMSRLFGLRKKAYRPLLNQCRDEREYVFAEREGALEPGEYFTYIYAIFNLQQYFPVSYANVLPEALPADEVADRFIDALCELNQSRSFLFDEAGGSLHHHLRRYLIMFFDYAPARRSFEAEFARRFMNDHRRFRWPEKKTMASNERVHEIFGQPLATLKQMSKKELSRLYRQKAMELHPDQGGDNESFVELTEIYSNLMHGR